MLLRVQSRSSIRAWTLQSLHSVGFPHCPPVDWRGLPSSRSLSLTTKTVKTTKYIAPCHHSQSGWASRGGQRQPGTDSHLPDIVLTQCYMQPWTWLTQINCQGHQEEAHEVWSPEMLA